MKTTIEIEGFSILVEKTEEGIMVSALKDDETVESFTLELGSTEDDDNDGDDSDFNTDEQPDFEDETFDDDEELGTEPSEEDETEDETEDEPKLESVTLPFMQWRKKLKDNKK